jgi:hypothetical protein
MRSVLFIAVAIAAVSACAKKDTGASDSSAAAAMAPAGLTAAQLAGTWNGMSIPEGSDTATIRWTSIASETSSDIKVITQGQPDTVIYTRTIDADSLMVTSAPFTPPQPPGSAQVINRASGRLVDGKLAGTYVTVLASKPDSVIQRGRWEATRVP